jgi:hypothetical protein
MALSVSFSFVCRKAASLLIILVFFILDMSSVSVRDPSHKSIPCVPIMHELQMPRLSPSQFSSMLGNTSSDLNFWTKHQKSNK